MPIAALFAGVLALVYVVLTLRVIGIRRGERISLGDGGNAELQRRIRAHANFAEYVPIGLLLLALAESLAAPMPLLLAIGGLFAIGRMIHGVALSANHNPMQLRPIGMHLTLWTLLALAGTCLWFALARVLGY